MILFCFYCYLLLFFQEFSGTILESFKTINSLIRVLVNYYSKQKEFNNNINDSSKHEINKILIDVIDYIGQKGFLVMLGVRLTNKSSFDLPPKREKIVNEFNKPFSLKSKITVGARAVTKHADRNRESFWGNVSGNEETRNINSNLICLDIIANAAWISIFEMNSNTRIVEIRNSEGFGLRWVYNDYFLCSFKGLVEPQWEKGKKKEEVNDQKESKHSSDDSE